MRILHITAIISLDGKSGIPAVVKGLCEHQNKIDGVVSRVLSVRATIDNVGSPYYHYLGNGSFKDYLAGYKPDIAIFHDFYYYQYALMCRCLKRMHIPFVLEPHGAFGKQAKKKSWLKKTVANNTLFRGLIKRSNGFIFTNEGEKRDTAYHNRKEVVIPNGVEENAVDSHTAKDYKEESRPVFYFLGRYDINHKGLDYLFDALDILDSKEEDVTVNMYGIGGEKELAYVHERINGMKNIRIEDKGTIYDEEKVKALRKANILLLTSRYEGSPMTILDALSYGNPCLVTPGTNVADEIVANGLGWKTELKAEAIAECILKASKDYQQNYGVYYDKCRRYVLDNFLWDKIAQQSVGVYKQLIG
jgi:glycosyltransferase involved in cell wall biosynthesis